MAKGNKGILWALGAVALYALYAFRPKSAVSVHATGSGNSLAYTNADDSVEIDIDQTYGGSTQGFSYSVFVPKPDGSGELYRVLQDSIYAGDQAIAQATMDPDYAVATTPTGSGVTIQVLRKSNNSIVFSKTLTYTGGPA